MAFSGVVKRAVSFTHGIVALAVQPDCTLTPAWQQTAGPANDFADDNYSPANGVVYLTTGLSNGSMPTTRQPAPPLWNSAAVFKGPVMNSPTVDGRVFAASWDHHLYAFGL